MLRTYAPATTDGGPASNIVAEINTDSITTGGCRLVTWELTYPRMVHAELMTHRAFSRNSASSRAIPAKKLRERIESAPVIPAHWGQNQKGMQADAEIADIKTAEHWWRAGLGMMAAHHQIGESLGLHKQIVNRIIEPWMPITVIVSATDHANWFHLRNHKDAEPNIQKLAALMWELFHEHLPTFIKPGGWHLPYIDSTDLQYAASTEELLKISVGRCARVSYLTHDGVRDKAEDIALHDKLARTASDGIDPMHASPFEHQAQARGLEPAGSFGLPTGTRVDYTATKRYGNFEGWRQYRKQFEHEAGPLAIAIHRCSSCGCWDGNHVTTCPNAKRKI